MDAGLIGVEIDEGFELGEEEGGRVISGRGDVDDLLDPANADARKAHAGVGDAGLDVWESG